MPSLAVPRNHYQSHAHTPYPTCTRRQSEVPRPDFQEHLYKMQLAHHLNACQITQIHQGFPFPFHCTPCPRTIYNTYLDPFEIQQELSIPGQPSVHATIKFNGHAPRQDKHLTWQASLSGADILSARNSRTRTPGPIAKVQVDLMIASSFFWHALSYDPSTILRALAISLEIGKPISIELVDSRTVIYVAHGTRERKNYLVVRQ